MAIYRAPGVFFTEYTQSIGSTAFGYNRTAIIGVGQSYTNISNLELIRGVSEESDSDVSDLDAILLPSGTPAQAGDILSIQGIGNIPGYYNYTLGTDYTIDADNTTITWISANKPAVNSTFYITYKLNKSESRGDFDAKLLFNQTQIAETYGPEYLNGVIQPLTLGADLVLEGQSLLGGGVYCVQVTADTVAAYKAAIDKLDKINVQTVIILKQDDISLRNYLIEKNAEMSSNLYKKFRTTFIVPNDDALTQDAIVAQRAGLDNDRVTYFANKKVTIQLTDADTQETKDVALSAIYACCNLSGIEGFPEYTYSEPMLRKQLSSRITLQGNQVFDPSERNYLCSNFLSAFDFNENTNLTFVFDIYTCNSLNVLTETRSVRRVTDLLMVQLDKQLDIYIGQKNSTALASSAQCRVQDILDKFIDAEEIKDYKNVQASYDPQNPKQLNVSFDYVPLFEVKWVHCTIGKVLE